MSNKMSCIVFNNLRSMDALQLSEVSSQIFLDACCNLMIYCYAIPSLILLLAAAWRMFFSFDFFSLFCFQFCHAYFLLISDLKINSDHDIFIPPRWNSMEHLWTKTSYFGSAIVILLLNYKHLYQKAFSSKSWLIY